MGMRWSGRVAVSLWVMSAWSAEAFAADEVAPPSDPMAILGGDLVEPCGFPTAVSIGGSCTGTLVHPRVVVYAAHCGDEVAWIRFGDRFDTDEAPGFEVIPERCETHPVGQFGFGTDAAFCVLSEPVEDIPLAPPLMGCEADAALVVGQPVTVAGFGNSDDEENPYGIKRYLDTEITSLSWDEVFIGGENVGVCYGDSGGPTYTKASDGSWRSFGITSWGQPGCGFGGYLSTTSNNMLWLETASGVDITPCHDGEGNWDPSPECFGFDMRLHAEGGDWADGCDFGEVSGHVDTCGSAFDPDALDSEPPAMWFTDPPAQSRFELAEGKETARVPVAIAYDDAGGWGVGEVELVIERDGAEQARLPDAAAPFAYDNLAFSEGVWTLRIEALDRAGNEAQSEPVHFGIGVDPPPLPDPDPDPDPETSGGGSSSDGDGPEPIPGTTGDADPDADDGDGDSETAALDDGAGCACTTQPGGGGGAWLWLVPIVGFLVRRRSAALALASLAACGDDIPDVAAGGSGLMGGAPEGATTTGGADTTEEPPSDSSSDGAPMREGSTGTEPVLGCGNGILEDDERCDDANMVDGDGCSADCEPSGELLEHTLWPQDERYATAQAIAAVGDGTFIVTGRRELAAGRAAALTMAVSADLEVTWFTETADPDPSAVVSSDAVGLAGDGSIWSAGWRQYDTEEDTLREPWVARLDAAGEAQWTSSISGELDVAEYHELVVLPGGDAVAVGSSLLGDFTRRWIVRSHAAADGAVQWQDVGAESDHNAQALSASLDSDGNVVVAGWEEGFGGHRDLRLRTYAPDGEVLDTKVYAEPLTSYYPRAIDATVSGEVAVCGTVIRASAEAAMIGRFITDAEPTPLWLAHIATSGPGASRCNGMVVDDAGRPAVAGYTFHSETTFDVLAGRISDQGEILWSERTTPSPEGYLQDVAEGIALDPDGNVVVVGFSDQSRSATSIWIARLRG